MHNHYIINDIVEFHPATSTLRDLNNPERVVIFNSPAGRCLLLLIERAGTVVTKAEFFDAVWTTSGMQVSSNTFYQNIYILRNGLKKIGLSEDLVVTIPRLGLTLSSSAHIRKITTDQQVKISTEIEHVFDEQSMVSTQKASPPQEDRQEEMPGETVSQPVEFAETKSRGRICLLHLKLIAALIGVVAIGVAIINLNRDDEKHYFSHYHFYKSIQGCQIFLSEGIVSDEYYTQALARSQLLAKSCHSYPWVYISIFPLLPRTSVIRCDKPINEINTCMSDYFLESK